MVLARWKKGAMEGWESTKILEIRTSSSKKVFVVPEKFEIKRTMASTPFRTSSPAPVVRSSLISRRMESMADLISLKYPYHFLMEKGNPFPRGLTNLKTSHTNLSKGIVRIQDDVAGR